MTTRPAESMAVLMPLIYHRLCLIRRSGQPTTLGLAAGALLLAATEAGNVKGSRAAQGILRALVNHPDSWPRITAPRDPRPS